MRSKIVYRINCLDCEKSSIVHKHTQTEKHRIDWDDMQIVDTARDDRRLLLKEMLHINNLKPQLNVEKSSKLFSLLIGSNEKVNLENLLFCILYSFNLNFFQNLNLFC